MLSHLVAMRTLYDTTAAFVLVLEDDAVPFLVEGEDRVAYAARLARVLGELQNDADPRWEVANLGPQIRYHGVASIGLRRIEGSDELLLSKHALASHFMAYHRRSLQHVPRLEASLARNEVEYADRWYSDGENRVNDTRWICPSGVRLVIPRRLLASQVDGYSDTEEGMYTGLEALFRRSDADIANEMLWRGGTE